jgi:glycosyltransferase involved in cell wall biosynthesis
MKIRLHLPGIPHTITKDEYSHCAFTGKVQRFAPMMKSVGYEVYYYGTETSTSGADKQFDILSLEEFNKLRYESCKKLFPQMTDHEINEKLKNPKQFIGDLANLTTPLYKTFNKNFREKLIENYRSRDTDIVCLPFGPAHEDAIRDLNYVFIESGIGYNNAYKDLRIYESYAIMHHYYGKEYEKSNTGIHNYWFVCPNYYDLNEWVYNEKPIKKRIGFFGRITGTKGVNIFIEIAKKFPDVEFTICGSGDPTTYLKSPNIVYIEPLHGKDRTNYLNNLTALITPTQFLEPFCGVSVEAQLCGTPVISHDYGAFVENIEPFKTGLRCHTLSDFCYGVQMAIDGKFDRKYIRERAVKLFDMYNVARKYDYVFKSIINIYNGTNGWYSDNHAVHLLENEVNEEV